MTYYVILKTHYATTGTIISNILQPFLSPLSTSYPALLTMMKKLSLPTPVWGLSEECWRLALDDEVWWDLLLIRSPRPNIQ